MFNFEKLLIIAACAIPIIALSVFMFKRTVEKLKKPKNKKQEPVQPQAEVQKVEEKPKEIEPVVNKNKSVASEISTDDFKAYLNKRKEISKPKKLEHPQGFQDRTMQYMPTQRSRIRKHKSIAEEIQTLSPELKALILSGALDRRDFED